MTNEDREERIRRRAYRLWLEEGCPEGREADHWDKASELIAIEENYRDTLKPNPLHDYERNPTTEPIESIEVMRNLGEFPTLVDQGEEATFPDRALVGEADEPPLASPQRGGAKQRRRTSAREEEPSGREVPGASGGKGA